MQFAYFLRYAQWIHQLDCFDKTATDKTRSDWLKISENSDFGIAGLGIREIKW